jgi:hypothetical protein
VIEDGRQAERIRPNPLPALAPAREPSIYREERSRKAPQDDDPNKPPRVLPNTYWTRKGGGWILEYKRKVKHKWQYEYFGLIDLKLWNKLKGRFDYEKLSDILKGIIRARRTKLQRARDFQTGRPRLRIVGKR